MKRQPEISYIVSLYNWPKLLPVCLWSLKTQSHEDFEVIVTDNTPDNKASESHRAVVASLHDARFRYVRSCGKTKVNDCYWSGEYGMKQAHGKWLCFPCEDCYYPPKWAERMLAVADGLELILCENNITDFGPNGVERYIPLRFGTQNYPGCKTSFLVRSCKFMGWIGKPQIPSCCGADRTTLWSLLKKLKWGVARDVFYFHN